MSEVIYTGRRIDPGQGTLSPTQVERKENGISRGLKHIQYHSPAGVNWGYAGSGPADLALSLLVDAFEEQPIAGVLIGGKATTKTYPRAWRLHQHFKDAFVAQWLTGWAITRQQILDWADGYDADHPQ